MMTIELNAYYILFLTIPLFILCVYKVTRHLEDDGEDDGEDGEDDDSFSDKE